MFCCDPALRVYSAGSCGEVHRIRISRSPRATATCRARSSPYNQPFRPVQRQGWGRLDVPVQRPAMALYQAGRLDLDVPVQKYCPAFPKKQWTITTRELLGHLSGIRHYKQDNSDVFSTKHYAHISDAFEVFADEPLLFEPGTKMQYTTFGYDVVGCVIEGASGEDFVSALNALVLGPARMTSTRTDDAFAIVPHRSRPYTVAADHSPRNAPFVDTRNKVPGGGMISTADDLARFAIALESGQLLNCATTQLMWTSQKTSDGKATGYAYGWGVHEENGVRTVGHTGGQPGCSSAIWMLPDQGFAVTIMANTDEVKVLPMAEALARAYLDAHTVLR